MCVPVQRGLLDRPPVLTYSPTGRRNWLKRGITVGRRRDEASLFELLRDPNRNRGSEGIESPDESDPPVQSKESDTGSRRKVALDDRAKKIPTVRRLPPIPESPASPVSDGGSPAVTRSLLSEVVEVRLATILVFSIATVIAIALAFIAGRSSSVVTPPAGMNEMRQDSPPWPVIDPEPEPRPAIRNVEQNGVAGDSVAEVPVEPVEVKPEVVPVARTLWSVMIGQHLSSDPQVIDQLVQYVDSGLSFSQSRVRISTSRGTRTFSVFIGPFEEQDRARSALREIQSLRPYLGVRFRDAYPTRMVFSPEELQNFGIGN